MSTETREYCDCCRDEMNPDEDGSHIYRRKVRLFRKRYWPPRRPPEVE